MQLDLVKRSTHIREKKLERTINSVAPLLHEGRHKARVSLTSQSESVPEYFLIKLSPKQEIKLIS